MFGSIHRLMQKSRLVLISAFLLLTITSAFAGEPIVWEMGSRAELLKGESRGVSITDTGVVTLAPNVTQLFNTEQAYVWAAAVDAAGNIYLGTGHDGKLFRVLPDGKALAVAGDGAIFAATSPDGKVYRVTGDGKAEIYFDPPDKYIWSLAILKDGSLAVGTGDNGKLYRVRTAGAKPESSLLVDTNQTHVMSLAVTPQGELYAGTDPGGLVLRISPEGRAFAVYDAALREIHALAPAADGSIYALALTEAAATTKAATSPAASPDATAAVATMTTVSADETGTIQTVQQPQPARSRNDLSNARTAVFRILPDGGNDVLWSSTTVTGFALVASPGGVLI